MEHIEHRALLGKVLYGAIFVLLVPNLLILWAHGTQQSIRLKAIQSLGLGTVLVAAGLTIILFAMVSLYTRGGGLPMNAFPPPRLVRTGIYGLVPHPIYGGFVIVCAGVAIMAGSASGLWLITPVIAMASCALVLGYELPDLKRRFGEQITGIWVPAATDGVPLPIERVRVYFSLILPWLVAYECALSIGPSPDAIATYLPFESRIPVLPWSEAIYASTYVVVALAPILFTSRGALRIFVLRGLIGMALVFPLFLLLPFIAPPRPFAGSGPLATMLQCERTMDSAAAAFPSFHVVWALVAASALGHGSRYRKVAWFAWALLVAASCITTGMHSIADVFAGFVTFTIILKLPAIWNLILRFAEATANSWHEWRFGQVRVINHGAYAGAATFIGMTIIGAIVGPRSGYLVLFIYLGATVGAALWAQWVEGSPALLRPLGFYGGMFGSIIGALIAIPLHINLWVTLGAICIAAPFIQGIGRLRCLVQGCCHGRAVSSVPGIRYTHPSSRVCRLAHLQGVPVHATQMYSILCNGIVALGLLRLVQLHASTTLICGVYLIISGFGRFVEEAYRGEPQTLVVGGLRLYQWLAIATVVTGASLTTVADAPPLPTPTFNVPLVFVTLACGLAAWFVTGVDFPESSRRFARLT